MCKIKVIPLIAISFLICSSISHARTIFFPSGIKTIDIPENIYTLYTASTPSKKNLPSQYIILGIQNEEVLLYDGEENKVKGIPLNKTPEHIKNAAIKLQKKLKETVYIKNIFPQGVLPEFLNYLPSDYTPIRMGKLPTIINKGEITLLPGVWTSFTQYTSPVIIRKPGKKFHIAIIYESKGITPRINPVRPIGLFKPLMQYRKNTTGWKTQIDIWEINSKLVEIELSNRRLDKTYKIKNIKIYVLN
jgi:hypothetical protein